MLKCRQCNEEMYISDTREEMVTNPTTRETAPATYDIYACPECDREVWVRQEGADGE